MEKDVPKYELLFREGREVCGPPFEAFVAFFAALDQRNCRVLDLGCGQGRDALFIARRGHSVVGVDISETGISQMLEDAGNEGLAVTGVVADIVAFEPEGHFDVVLLDRVLHMLENDEQQTAVLTTVSQHTKPGGFVLIADMPKNKGLLLEFFGSQPEAWQKLVNKKGILFLQKEPA